MARSFHTDIERAAEVGICAVDQFNTSHFALGRKDFVAVNFSTTVGRLMLQGHEESNPKAYAMLDEALGNERQYDALCRRYADIAAVLMRRFDGNLVFVPHVTGGAHCDFMFMDRIAGILEVMGFQRPMVAPGYLSAPQYKWIIGQSRLFVGARTHSTIAALSSGVPTVALAYSLKARGLIRDIYGHESFCIPGAEANAENVLHAVDTMIAQESELRELVEKQANVMAARAMSAGEKLACFG